MRKNRGNIVTSHGRNSAPCEQVIDPPIYPQQAAIIFGGTTAVLAPGNFSPDSASQLLNLAALAVLLSELENYLPANGDFTFWNNKAWEHIGTIIDDWIIPIFLFGDDPDIVDKANSIYYLKQLLEFDNFVDRQGGFVSIWVQSECMVCDCDMCNLVRIAAGLPTCIWESQGTEYVQCDLAQTDAGTGELGEDSAINGNTLAWDLVSEARLQSLESQCIRQIRAKPCDI